jgi:low affinity Fe/Cu permease
MLLYLSYYVVAIAALVLHFTGHLERWGMEWLLVVLAITIFPVVLYL